MAATGAASGVGGVVALPTAGFEVAGLATAGLPTTGFDIAGLAAAGLDGVADLAVAGLETVVFSAAFAVFFSISLLLFLEDFAADGPVDEDLADEDLALWDLAVESLPVWDLAVDGLPAAGLEVEVLTLDGFTAPRAVFAAPRARFLSVVLRLAAVVFPAPFEILFLRVFCDTACARKTLAPLFKFFP